MAIVKCQNPQCDYFQKPVPEGDYCPFCGEPLPTKPSPSPPPPPPPVVQTPIVPPPPPPPPVVQTPIVPPPPPPPPVVQTPIVPPQETPPTVFEGSPFAYPTLKLIHTSGKEFMVISGQKAYIGRRGGQKKPHPEIDITDLPFSERVSRPHAHIFWDEQAKDFIIVDNQSTNGTVIDGDCLKPWHPYPLKNGAILELGREHHIQFTVEIR
ncbi:FHA domain-containing protein [Gloeothece citriformis]|uniref:FHA domain-containing protein n=1 Tax=Gloeothece citriformis TaxID=2546356 RepID=UPI0012FF0C67|nr:FHA domain-containing protein [Gloeothece citriformis]